MQSQIRFTLLKYLREHVFFIPRPTGLIQLFALKFRLKQRSGRMLYTTASKHLQKSWTWPYVQSVDNHFCPPNYFEQCKTVALFTFIFANVGTDRCCPQAVLRPLEIPLCWLSREDSWIKITKFRCNTDKSREDTCRIYTIIVNLILLPK